MSQEEFFSGSIVRARNPLRLYGLTRFIVGLAYVAASAWVIAAWLPELRATRAAPLQVLLESPASLLAAVRAMLAIALLVAGIRTISRGVGGVTRFILPPNAPRDLSHEEIESALARRELPGYAMQDDKSSRFFRRWFPHQLALLTQSRRAFVDEGLREIGRTLWLLAALLLAVAAVEALPPDALLVIGPYRATLPVWFLITYVSGAALYVSAAIRSLPHTAPRTDVAEFRAIVRGGGDPVHLPHGLRHELEFLRPPNGAPNRSAQIGFSMYEGGVRDAGQFDGTLLVENQPVMATRSEPPVTRVLLIAGSFYQVAALYWFYRWPALATLRELAPAASVMLMAYWFAQVGGAILLQRLGARLIAGAVGVLNTMRFRSVAVCLSIKGNFARSQLRVGAATQDSIESENLVVRSDCTVSGYAAALLSESVGATGTRNIVGMLVDDTVRDVESRVNHWLRVFEQQGASIVGVAVEGRALGQVMQANLVVDAERTARAVQAADVPSGRVEPPSTQLLLPPPGTQAPPEPIIETKSCPECAEPVRAAALKCRYCGYRFGAAAT